MNRTTFRYENAVDQRWHEIDLIIQPDGRGGVTIMPETPASRALDILQGDLQSEPLYRTQRR